MDTRRRLTQIAVAQHGLVTADQARAAGLTRQQIRWLTRSGAWKAIRPKVYALVGVPPTWVQAVAAAVLAVGPEAWASHATAAALWAMPRIEPYAIEVVTPLGRRVGLPGVTGHRSSALFTKDLSAHRRVPVTTPERTLVDLSARMAPDQLGTILDDGLRRRLIRLDRVGACVGRLACAPGRSPATVHALLAERLPGYDPGDSDLETQVLRILVTAGLPPPVQQHRVRLGNRSVKIDLAYPELLVAIELDGWEFHGNRTAFDQDRARANLLVAAGWTLLRFTSRSPAEEIVSCVLAARRAAAAA